MSGWLLQGVSGLFDGDRGGVTSLVLAAECKRGGSLDVVGLHGKMKDAASVCCPQAPRLMGPHGEARFWALSKWREPPIRNMHTRKLELAIRQLKGNPLITVGVFPMQELVK